MITIDFSTHSDADLAAQYADITSGADPTSPDFDLDHAGELAAELEMRGFTESQGSWRHPEKGTLVTDP